MRFIRDIQSRVENRRRNYKTSNPETGEVTMQQTLTAPPRPLSFLSRFYILISGWQTNIGFCFLGFGLLLLILGLRISQKESAREASGGTWQTTVATVSSVAIEREDQPRREITKNSRFYYGETDTYIYQYIYTVEGKNYKTRTSLNPIDHEKLNKLAGDTLMIEYFSTEHGYSNIIGYRSTGFSHILMLIGLPFAIAGVAFLLISLRKRAKTLQLYMRGLIAWGEETSRVNTKAMLNDVSIFKYVYTFKAQDGQQYEATANAPADFNIGDQGQELVLYLPENPSYNIIFDAVDSAPIVKEDGSLLVEQKIGSWFSLILCIVFTCIAIAAPLHNM